MSAPLESTGFHKKAFGSHAHASMREPPCKRTPQSTHPHAGKQGMPCKGKSSSTSSVLLPTAVEFPAACPQCR
eukprot:1119156-Pelagomonas_calceolata.AAC.1